MSETLEEFIADMERLSVEFCDDLTDCMRECKGILLEGVEKNFETSRASNGNRWPRRKDPVPQHPLLIKTGQLREAAIGKGAASTERVGTHSITLGVDASAGKGSIAAAARHQFGDPPPGILARPFMGISGEVADECAEMAADHALLDLTG